MWFKRLHKNVRSIWCTNAHHDVTDLVNHGMITNWKTWISWEWNITFPWNKKVLNQQLRRHFLKSYRFVTQVTFNHVPPGVREANEVCTCCVWEWSNLCSYMNWDKDTPEKFDHPNYACHLLITWLILTLQFPEKSKMSQDILLISPKFYFHEKPCLLETSTGLTIIWIVNAIHKLLAINSLKPKVPII